MFDPRQYNAFAAKEAQNGFYNSAWTDEKVKELTELWGEGKSAGEIGLKLGMTRGAICGKVHRLGLPARRATLARARSQHKQQRTKHLNPHQRINLIRCEADRRAALLEPVHIVDLPAEESKNAVSFFKLKPSNCRWPLGDPRDLNAMKFCGERHSPGMSYCARHGRMAYRPKQRKPHGA